MEDGLTQDEQQQVNAAFAYLERQCANLAREGAQMASNLEACAQQLKAARDELAALKKADNVVPIDGSAA